MAHWEYIVWAVIGVVNLVTGRNLPLAVVRLVGALTKDPERSLRCAEILRLARKDAKDLPSYFVDDSEKESSAVREPPNRQRARLRHRPATTHSRPPAPRPASPPAAVPDPVQSTATAPLRGQRG